MINLYELSQEYLNVLEDLQVDEITGEVINCNILDSINAQYEEKAEAIGLFIKNLNATAIAIKTEEKALEERRKILENKAEKLKNYLANEMQLLGKLKIETNKIILFFRTSTVVKVESDFLTWAKINADELLTYKTPDINKKAIKEVLKNGGNIKYAELEKKQNLQIK